MDLNIEIDKLRDELILKVDARLNPGPEAENAFMHWARCFQAYAPETDQAFEELKPHVNWTPKL